MYEKLRGELMKTLFKIIILVSSISLGIINLPALFKGMRKAQMILLIESRSVSWGKPWMPD